MAKLAQKRIRKTVKFSQWEKENAGIRLRSPTQNLLMSYSNLKTLTFEFIYLLLRIYTEV